jgi:hypothetical protein
MYNLGNPKQPESYSSGITDDYTFAIPANDGVIDPLIDRSANSNDMSLAGSPAFSDFGLSYG